jgi:hypothetical protein
MRKLKYKIWIETCTEVDNKLGNNITDKISDKFYNEV